MVDAVSEMLDIHHRMPVILQLKDHDRWLRAPANEAMRLVEQYPADQLLIDHTAEIWTAAQGKLQARFL